MGKSRIDIRGVFLAISTIGLGTLFAVSVVEVLLRFYPSLLPEEPRLRIHWSRLVENTTSIAHPYIGFLYPAHHQGEIVSGNFRFTYKTDGYGFRNRWPWPERVDIVAVGDSLTFGYGVEDNEAWTTLLDARLPRSHVLNLALIGAAPQQYFRVYERFGSTLKPKLLLFGLFPGNDVKDAGIFDQWQAAGSEGNYDVWRFFQGQIPKTSGGMKYYMKKSYVVLFLLEFRRIYRSPGIAFPKSMEFPDGGRLHLHPYTPWWESVEDPQSCLGFQLILQTIGQTQSHAHEHGTNLLVLLLPTREEVYFPLLGDRSPNDSGPFGIEFEERGIRFLNLTRAFQERAREGKQLFFEVDGHPNALGNALIAEVVLAHLRDNAELYGLRDWL